MALFQPEVTISTPGKVLASGGYMVLQDGHAVVLSTTSRFYSNIKSTFTHKISNTTSFHIKVLSPQFQKHWAYSASWDISESQASDFKFAGIAEESDGTNVFVQFALFYGLAAAACLPQHSKLSAGHYDLTVTLQADNDFYSHSKSLKDQHIIPTQENLRKLSRFAVLGSSIAKTGLGSSAALVSSLSTAMLAWAFGWSTQALLSSDASMHLAHNVAQVAHCQAQGKVGSGFDVSSALFGSQHFVRFRSEDINKIMDAYVAYSEQKTGIAPVLTALAANITQSWIVSTDHIALPPGVSMILGECGKDFNTPTSVRKVLDWAKRESEQWKSIFDAMNENNLTLLQHLAELIHLSKIETSSYQETLKSCAALPAAEWHLKVASSSTLEHLLGTRACFGIQRKLMKNLGNMAETPVEPDEISRVLNDTENLAGVLATGSPGAGGYDAVFALLLGDSIIDEVEKFWNAHQETPLSCLLSRECSDGVLLVGPTTSTTSEAAPRLTLCPFGLMQNGPAVVASSPLLMAGLGAALLTGAIFAVARHFRSQRS